MPLYEYRCARCGARFSRLLPMSAPRDGVDCQECGEPAATRLMSSFATAGGKAPASSNCPPGSSGFG